MKRREFLDQSKIVGGLGLLAAVGGMPRAFAHTPDGSIAVSSDISRNHGHALTMTSAMALEHLRTTMNDGPSQIDIQGDSGHPHTVELNGAQMLKLFVEGEIETESSNVSGHTHTVNIKLQTL